MNIALMTADSIVARLGGRPGGGPREVAAPDPARPAGESRPAPGRRLTALFSALTLLLGFVYLLLTPPFQVPDEPHHFLRAWQVGEGRVWGTTRGDLAGGLVPQAVNHDVQLFNDLMGKPDNRLSRDRWRQAWHASPPLTAPLLADRIFANFPNTVLYSPVPYLPQALALVLAKALALNTLAALYLSRFLTLMVSVALLTAAYSQCSWSPRLAFTLFLLAALPMSLFELASASADALTIALGFLTLALCLRLLRQWSAPRFWWLLGCAGLLALCKSVYFLLPLAALPAIFQARATAAAHGLYALALVAASLLPALAWNAAVAGVYVPGRLDGGIDPRLQLQFLWNRPDAGLTALLATWWQEWRNYAYTGIGVLGWLDTWLPPRVYSLYPCLLGLAVFTGPAPRRTEVLPPWWAPGFTAGIFLASAVLLSLACYLSWTPPGAARVEGLQGRYFLPLTPLLLLWLPPLASLPESRLRLVRLTVFLAWLYLAGLSALALYHRYWEPGFWWEGMF